MSNENVVCYACQTITAHQLGTKIPKSEECSSCSADLRCCKMCAFYDTKSYNECKEPSAERIVEKEKSNFCDYFSLSGPRNHNENQKEDLLAAAKALFKD